jgi:hypothetical protein
MEAIGSQRPARGYDVFWLISHLSPYQHNPAIQLAEVEMVGACLECHASRSLL